MTLDDACSLALRAGWLSRQPEVFARRLLSGAQLRQLQRGAMLYGLGDPAGSLYCVASGCLDVLASSGPFPPTLAHLARPGFWIGEAALLGETTRLVATIARTDAAVLVLAPAEVRRCADEAPETWRRIGAITAGHLDTALSFAICRSGEDHLLRVAVTLLRLSEPRDPHEDRVTLPLSHAELGEICGLSRNSVGRALTALARSGTVEAGYGRVMLPDPPALAALISR